MSSSKWVDKQIIIHHKIKYYSAKKKKKKESIGTYNMEKFHSYMLTKRNIEFIWKILFIWNYRVSKIKP